MKHFILILIALFICSCTLSGEKRFDLNTNLSFVEERQKEEINNLILVETSQFVFTPTPLVNHKAAADPCCRLVRQGPGEVYVPILLYHHITIGTPANAYSVSQTIFRDQMEYLFQNGFKTVSMADLVRSIQIGADLPKKPVMITFDDGNENVFFNAFPIMRERGLNGIVLIIANRMNVDGFLSVEQLRGLYNQGWEIGSHGMRHIDLVKEPTALRDEISNSKKRIEKSLDLEITIFAYPYGKADPLTMNWVKQIGYHSALGLGISNKHDSGSIFYLQRREVKNEFSLVEFAQLLEKSS